MIWSLKGASDRTRWARAATASAAVGVRLAGTLTSPPGNGPFPGMVLISGSAPNGRDEELGHHKFALVLADALSRDGYAVLRYDKRGVAKSSGNCDAATTLDSASDAAAAVAYMRSRSDIAQAKLGLIGHSEGGTIAAMVAEGSGPGLYRHAGRL